MLIGQENLKQSLETLIDSNQFPKTSILVGPEGQGKKTVANWIAKKLKALLYVPNNLKIDSIREIKEDSLTLSNNKLYLLADAEDMTIQAQNALLKLAEEPPEYAYIVMTVQDTHSLLPTILSRSAVYQLDNYTQQELRHFTNNEELLNIATNPGTIKKLEQMDYKALLDHSFKVVDNIGKISASNAFNILRYVDKENYTLFLDMLIYCYGERIRAGLSATRQLRVVYETRNLLARSKSINKQNAIEMMLVQLREVARGEVQ